MNLWERFTCRIEDIVWWSAAVLRNRWREVFVVPGFNIWPSSALVASLWVRLV